MRVGVDVVGDHGMVEVWRMHRPTHYTPAVNSGMAF